MPVEAAHSISLDYDLAVTDLTETMKEHMAGLARLGAFLFLKKVSTFPDLFQNETYSVDYKKKIRYEKFKLYFN